MQTTELVKFFISLALACVPAGAWAYIFYKKQVGQKSMTFITFVTGAVFVTPLLFYKYLWQYFPWLNAFQYTHPFKDDLVGFSNVTAIPLDVILTFLIVGIIEEITKLWAMKVTDRGRITSIDDAIEMAICAALGFAFAENILYFYNIITSKGLDGILSPFIFRSLFSTFAHVMFSGVLGYYYGIAHFAGPILQDKNNQKRYIIFRKLAQIFHLKKDVSFHEEKLMEGLVIAIGLHALFDIFLEMNWTFFLVPYLTGGFILLSYLLEKKEDHIQYGLLLPVRNHEMKPSRFFLPKVPKVAVQESKE